jgi:hypothetical protein
LGQRGALLLNSDGREEGLGSLLLDGDQGHSKSRVVVQKATAEARRKNPEGSM